MKLSEQIQANLQEAMKAREELRLSTLRLLSSELKNKSIEKKDELSDDDVLATIKTMVKQYKDALTEFEAAGRDDLVEKQAKEIEILEKYLPAQMPEEEVEKIVHGVIEGMGDDATDFGKVMGAAMKEIAGRADGGVVRDIVKKVLQ